LGALAWWGLGPKPVEASYLAPRVVPLAATGVDPAATLAMRLSARGAFGIFPQNAAPGAVASSASLRLVGTAISPGRRAALVAVGGAKPQWLAIGEPQGGLELVELATGRAVVRTSSGDTVTLELFPQMSTPVAANSDGGSHGG
jgi:hypothetical protein